jgi:hypothetical protein
MTLQGDDQAVGREPDEEDGCEYARGDSRPGAGVRSCGDRHSYAKHGCHDEERHALGGQKDGSLAT